MHSFIMFANAEDAAAYGSCRDAATSVDGAVRDELIASWPTGTVEDWIASLSDDAAAAAGSCAR